MERKIMQWIALMLVAAVFIIGTSDILAGEEEPEIYHSGKYTYVLQEDGTAKLCSCNTDFSTISLPEELDGCPVTAIAENTFETQSERSTITQIEIPDSIIRIEGNPFRFCGELVQLSVSEEHPVYT